jgi:group I intron endonuclease
MDELGCIYLITCLLNGKFYVGQHNKKNVAERWRAHKQKAAKEVPEFQLHKAMKKHGVENFRIDILCIVPYSALDKYEMYFADLLNTYVWNKRGYNSVYCGGGAGGRQITEVTRQRLRDSHMGKQRKPESIKKSIESMKEWAKNNPEAVSIRSEKVSKALKGRYNKDWGSHTPEAHAKVGEKLRGYKHGIEFSKNVSASRKVGKSGEKYITITSGGFYVNIDNRISGKFGRLYSTMEEAIKHRDEFLSSGIKDKRITQTGERHIRISEFSGFLVYINNKKNGKFSKTFPILEEAIKARDDFLGSNSVINIPN